MNRRLLTCAIALSLFAAEARAGGVIRGTIWSTRGEARRAEFARELEISTHTERRGLFAFLGSPGLRKPDATPATHAPGPRVPQRRNQPGLTDAVIWLLQVPEPAERRLAQQNRRDRSRPNPRMLIGHSRFQPRVMTVAAGTDVEIQNLDRIWHSTFSVSAAQRFDLGKLRPGAIDTVAMTRPGVINLHCDIHPEETGFLVVTPNHAFARPDSLGSFTLPKLPPGTYKVELWHPQRGAREQIVVVPKRGDVTCDLAF